MIITSFAQMWLINLVSDTMTLRNRLIDIYVVALLRRFSIMQNIIYTFSSWDKVTEILIAYNRRKCHAILVREEVRRYSWWNMLFHSLRVCVRFDKRASTSSSLYCAMQLVRKSFSTRSHRAVFVRWPLNDARDRWIEPFDRRVIGIAALYSTRMKVRSLISIILVASNVEIVTDASLFRDWCFQEMDKNFSLNLCEFILV